MPTPTKPVSILNMEKRSHRTKKELAQREKAEKAQLTGKRMKEAEDVRKDPDAHAVWLRMKALLSCIGRDDAMYEQVINRYCRLTAEISTAQKDVERLNTGLSVLERAIAAEELTGKEYVDRMGVLMEEKMSVEAVIMRKRKMLLDIEKENIMTIAASLRSVPKKPLEEEPDPMANLIKARQAMR